MSDPLPRALSSGSLKDMWRSGTWFLAFSRAVIGYMWFQQTLWKLPPNWGGPGGLRHWIELSGEYGQYGFYRSFIKDVFLKHFDLFAPQVWATETLIAISLVFGVFTRLGGLLSGIMALNLYVALGKSPNEWYWSYLFIALFGFLFVFLRAGRYIGVDQLLAPRLEARASRGNRIARALIWLT